uniref:NADH-ubiquinone oxidoreductase chain 4 n=1 Tax=Trypetoptera punctulata TaxID=305554 RepID=A0A6B9RFM1_TRYPU|nr:NADH dehydrogenase subunit 4 [Trypetoptera punctulata]
MLKFIFMVAMLIPLCFVLKLYWTVQIAVFVMTFVLAFQCAPSFSLSMISYGFGVDNLSLWLIVLSFWICALMLTASEQIYKMSSSSCGFSFMVVVLLLFLTLSFSSLSLFQFYLFFESSLIPTLFLILGWGYQPERLQAGNYLLFYTLAVSLPMLIGIFYISSNCSTLNFYLLKSFYFNFDLLYFSLMMAFLVKTPMFLVHLWLPKAHVEAPISGSMILAGIMLKLGGYGMIRVFPFLMKMSLKYSFVWISISLVGGFLVSLVCLRQTDLKSLIAYSSVVHMGMALAGMMTFTEWGIKGGFVLMIGHGLCSSGLFCLANMSYERLMSRSLLLNKGMLALVPSLGLWWFLLCSSNMAAPPSLNLLGEIMLINSLVCWSFLSMIGIALISFFSAAYSLYLFSYSQHGKPASSLYSFSFITVREFALLTFHWVPLNLFILKGDLLVNIF